MIAGSSAFLANFSLFMKPRGRVLAVQAKNLEIATHTKLNGYFFKEIDAEETEERILT